MENRIKKLFEVFLMSGVLAMPLLSAPALADELGKDLQAVTPSGDQVILHPNGRWEFVDTTKAAEAKAAHPVHRGAISAWGAASR